MVETPIIVVAECSLVLVWGVTGEWVWPLVVVREFVHEKSAAARNSVLAPVCSCGFVTHVCYRLRVYSCSPFFSILLPGMVRPQEATSHPQHAI